MNRSSVAILESMLYKIPSLRNLYSLLCLPVVSQSDHTEVNNIVKNFNNPKAVIAIGITTSCFIIEKETKQKFHVIEISNDVFYKKCNGGELKRSILNVIRAKDFIPDPIFKKIAVIDSFEKGVEGEVYTLFKGSNRYTKESLSLESVSEFSKEELLDGNRILTDFLNGIGC